MNSHQPSAQLSDHSDKVVYRADAGKFAMWLFLASLSMLFAASIIGYLVIRLKQPDWPPEGMPNLPSGLWLSTITIVCCSIAVHNALASIRYNHQAGLKKWISITTGLGVLFLIFQTINWLGLVMSKITMSVNLYAFTFFMLTGLHALHVIGGLVLLGIVVNNSFRGKYNDRYYPGVLYSAMYWHFLDAVWIVMFLVLLVFS